MKLNLQVKTQSKVRKVEKIDENNLKVFVNELAKEGKANKAVIEILVKYFNLPPSKIRIFKGFKSRRKVIEID